MLQHKHSGRVGIKETCYVKNNIEQYMIMTINFIYKILSSKFTEKMNLTTEIRLLYKNTHLWQKKKENQLQNTLIYTKHNKL